MEFKIVTPEGVIYGDQIKKVIVPTTAGEVTIHENHLQMVSILKSGEVTVFKDDHEVNLAVSGGMLEVKRTGEVYVIADTAERAEEIDVDRAEAARKRAEELLAQKEQMADVDFARLQAKIEKELSRISVGKKYRR
jgi:F-type H+-transporting ATPase subunit epsilon